MSPEEEETSRKEITEQLEVRDEYLGKLPSAALRIALPNTEAKLRVRKVRYGEVSNGGPDPETGIPAEKNQGGFGSMSLKCSLEVRLEIMHSLLRFAVVLMPQAAQGIFGVRTDADPVRLLGWNGVIHPYNTTSIRRPELHWWE